MIKVKKRTSVPWGITHLRLHRVTNTEMLFELCKQQYRPDTVIWLILKKNKNRKKQSWCTVNTTDFYVSWKMTIYYKVCHSHLLTVKTSKFMLVYNLPSWLQFWRAFSDKCAVFCQALQFIQMEFCSTHQIHYKCKYVAKWTSVCFRHECSQYQSVLKCISYNCIEHNSTFHIFSQRSSASINPLVVIFILNSFLQLS